MWQPRGAPRPSCMPTSGHLELNYPVPKAAEFEAQAAHGTMSPKSQLRRSERSSTVAPPVLRVNYDIVPGSDLHWVAPVRSSLARQAVHQSQPQQVQPSQQLRQQERQQTKQEMDTQVSSQAATPDENDAEDSSAGIAGHSVTYFLP
ncbi:hypothetical protein IscW_ISCW003995 [Ixodes scapularis]|uniref:Uncharacterized protein n=1 Tax=Ixodes scapularis TaxID=6945 RepID=B7PF77_IXOSC|nr:hypothetical protein IscW_ISCW003995 [Ixodes scapularis]|eukprot:XP_002433849.1 hypothetical protein IscW_ISCW003995 [Ixodes scapularis]